MSHLEKIGAVSQEIIDMTTDFLMPDYLRFALFCEGERLFSRKEVNQAIDVLLTSPISTQKGYDALRMELRHAVRFLFIGSPLIVATGFCSGVGSVAWAVGDLVEFVDCVDRHAIHSIETDQSREEYLKSTMTTCLDRDGVFSSEWTGQVGE